MPLIVDGLRTLDPVESVTLVDDGFIGIGPGLERITFDSDGNVITIKNSNLVIDGGNLTVTGTTTTVDSTNVAIADGLFELARDNSSDLIDGGIVIKYNDGADKYAGLFRDSTDGKFRLFKDTTESVPSATTINTGATGYAVATLVANIEGNVSGTSTGAVAATTISASSTVTFNGNVTLGASANDIISIPGTISNSSLIFEGATANDFELTLAIPDPTADVTVTLPNATTTLVGQDTTDTLTNKTLTSSVLNVGVSGTAVLDEDDLATNSATQLATQQSIKAYVDAQPSTISGATDTTITSPVDSHFLVHNGSSWVNETGSTARTSIGLGTGNCPEFTGICVTTGNVGIATSSPSYKLDVTGDINFTGNLYQDGSTFTSGMTEAGAAGFVCPTGSCTSLCSTISCSTTCVETPFVCTTNVGVGNIVTGSNAIGVGYQVRSTCTNSIASGYKSCASGICSTAVGSYSCATADYATAVGYRACAIANTTTASGHYTKATGLASSAFGYVVLASGACSTASGTYAQATNGNSNAFGRSSQATGAESTALGYISSATATGATAIGYCAVAASACQMVLGACCVQSKVFCATTGFYGDGSNLTGVAGGGWSTGTNKTTTTCCVGIGTTTPAATFHVAGAQVSSPNYPMTMTVVDDTSAYNATAPGGGIGFGAKYNASNNITNFMAGIQGFKENTTDGNYAGALRFLTRTHDDSCLVEKMRISASGNVTIGTNTSSYPLYICKSNADNWGLLVQNPHSGGQGILARTGGELSDDMILGVYSGSSYKGAWMADGKVGIGTTAPDTALHICGSTSALKALTIEGGGANLASTIRFKHLGGGSRTNIDGDWNIGFGSNETDFGSGLGGGGLNIWHYNGSSYFVPVYFKDDGNSIFCHKVGIGTTAPSSELEIESACPILSMHSDTWSATNQTQIQFKSGCGVSGQDRCYGSVIATACDWGVNPKVFRDRGGMYFDSNCTANAYYYCPPLEISFRTSVANDATPTERMRIDSAGNVGIGTTSPAQKLDVVGYTRFGSATNAGASHLQMRSAHGTSAFPGLSGNSQNSALAGLLFYYVTGTTETEGMRLNYQGNVGIGTASPKGILDVIHASALPVRFGQSITDVSSITVSNTYADSYLHLGGQEFTANSTRLITFGYHNVGTHVPAYMGYKEISTSNLTYGDLVFATRSVATDTEPTERMRIRYDGNVGIGTATPAQKLDVVGGHLRLDSGMSLQWDNSHERIEAYNGGCIDFYTNNSWNMRLCSGYLGIGTNAPQFQLHTTDRIKVENMMIGNWSSGERIEGNTADMYVGVYSDHKLTLQTNNTARMTICGGTGSVGIGCTSPSKKLDVAGTGMFSIADTAAVIANTSTTNRTAVCRPLTLYRSTGSSPYNPSGVGILFQGQDYGNTLREWGAVDAIMECDTNTSTFSSGLSLKVMPSAGVALCERMRIHSSGNVGIGTTSPDTKLDVDGGTSATEVRFGSNSANLSSRLRLTEDVANWPSLGGYIHYDGSANKFHFGTNDSSSDTNAITIPRGVACVGIGTVSPATNLHVSGNVHFGTCTAIGTSSTGQAVATLIQNFDSYTGLLIKKSGTSTGNYLAIEDSSANPIFSVMNNCNVGIGTTTPSELLHLCKSGAYAWQWVEAGTNSDRALTKWRSKTSAGANVDIHVGSQGDGQNGTVYTYTNHPLAFSTNNAAAQVCLATSGNFIINAYLQVKGWITGASNHNTLYSNSSTYGVLLQTPTNSTGATGQINFRNSNGATGQWFNPTNGCSYLGSCVGIGTALPSESLHVAGSACITGALLVDSSIHGLWCVCSPKGCFTDYMAVGGACTSGRTLTINSGTDNIPLKIVSTDSLAFIEMVDNAGTALIGNLGNKFVVANGSGAGCYLTVCTAGTGVGNVGIGTTTPASPLHIHSSGNIAHYITSDSNSTDSATTSIWFSHNYTAAADWAGMHFDADNLLRIGNEGTSNTAHLVINESGNVSIGTTSFDYDHQFKIYHATSPRMNFQNYTTGVANNDGFEIGVYASNNRPFLWNYENTDLYIATNNVERMRITAAGNVGIGTTAPQVKHHIYESTANTTVAQRFSVNYSTGTVYSGIEFAPSETGTVFGSVYYNHQANKLQFSNSSSGGGFGSNIRMVIDSAGNVGIECNAPAQKLDVAGNVKATCFIGDGANLTNVGLGSHGWATATNVTCTSCQVGIGAAPPAGMQLFVCGGSDYNTGFRSGSNRSGFVIYKPNSTQIRGSALVLDSDDSYRLGTASYYHLTMKTDGNSYFDQNLGIGTTTPAYTLDVDGVGQFCSNLIVCGSSYSCVCTKSPISCATTCVETPIVVSRNIGVGNTLSGGSQATVVGYQSTASGTLSTAVGRNVCATGNNASVFGMMSCAAGLATTAAGYKSCVTNVNSGNAFGYHSCVTGTMGLAVGFYSCATNSGANAVGRSAKATGVDSLALGFASTASGACSIAIGRLSCATDADSSAVGYTAKATGAYSSAFGRNSCAMGQAALGMGYYVSAIGTDAIALGNFACASVAYATAVGRNAIASGAFASAFGWKSQAIGSGSTASGYYSCTTSAGVQGSAYGDRSCATGISASAFGSLAKATATSATAIGRVSLASALESTVVGFTSTASGVCSSAYGWKACSTGAYSSASGYCATATDAWTSAYGRYTVASAIHASAFGNIATASGTYSTSVGRQTQATGNYSQAFGFQSCATGNESTAVGYMAKATNTNSVAVGFCSCATGLHSASFGVYSCVSGSYAIGIGRGAQPSASHSKAFGDYACASGVCSTALGHYAKTRIAYTTNIGGALIIKKDAGEPAASGGDFMQFSGVEVMLTTKEVDFKVVADHTITIPAGARFWINEMGAVVTCIDTLTAQPFIVMGITGNTDKHLDNLQTVNLTVAGKRERYLPTAPEDGESTLVVGVATAATGTTVCGRFYFKGVLIENE